MLITRKGKKGNKGLTLHGKAPPVCATLCMMYILYLLTVTVTVTISKMSVITYLNNNTTCLVCA